jgi:hypothetical protein
MYDDLSNEDQLLLAIDYHLNGIPIPNTLSDLLGEELVSHVTNVKVDMR